MSSMIEINPMKILYAAIEFDGTIEGLQKSVNKVMEEIVDTYKIMGNHANAIGHTFINDQCINYDFAIGEHKRVSLCNLKED